MDKNTIENFVSRVNNFDDLNLSTKTDYIIYFIQKELEISPITKAKIIEAFNLLRIAPLLSLASYLSTKSKKGNGQKFLKVDGGIILTRKKEKEIENELSDFIHIKPSHELYPLSLLENTRGYISKVGNQASIAYDTGLYDASLVMLRKLIEILIIELFERKGIENQIKNHNGDFYYLSDLIIKLKQNHPSEWNLSRNTRKGIDKIKRYGDLSAHNRRFVAKKPDLDKLKEPCRVIIQELIQLIDYPNWR